MPPPRDLAEVIRSLSDAMMRDATRALAGEPDGVHQARVAARRLREALALVTGPPKSDADILRAEARRLRGSLGPVREADVMLALLAERAQAHRWPAATVARVRRGLVDRRRRAARAAHHDLSRMDLAGLLGRSARVTASLDRVPRFLASARRLTRRARIRAGGLVDAIRQAGPFYAPVRFHEARIASKKLRYILELVRDVGRIRVEREIDALRNAQDTLGRLHDLQDLQSAVDAVAAEPPDRAARRTLSAMSGALAAECRRLHAEFLLTEPRLAEVARRARVIGVATRAVRVGRPMVGSGAAPRAAARRRPWRA
jgi:CHAD domain-containing protein